jgi:plastocyanin
MGRGLSIAAACVALALVAGCGSSGSGSSSSSGSTGTTSSSASSSAKQQTGGLKATTTPKYAAPSPSAPVQNGTVQISYHNIAIDPDTLKVKVGSTVKWTNLDPVEHNVTSKAGPISFASKNFGEGHTFEVKLTKPGVINYVCTIHPTTMNGTIEVVS